MRSVADSAAGRVLTPFFLDDPREVPLALTVQEVDAPLSLWTRSCRLIDGHHEAAMPSQGRASSAPDVGVPSQVRPPRLVVFYLLFLFFSAAPFGASVQL